MKKSYPFPRILIAILAMFLLAAWIPFNVSGLRVNTENAVPTPSPQPNTITNKIDPNVQRLLQEHPGEKVRIIVYMAKQADLSQMTLPKGPNIENKDQQRQLLYQSLTQTALNTQGPVISVLQGNLTGVYGVKSNDIESFWIFNGLAATADQEMITKLAALPDVGYIYEDIKISLPPDELQNDNGSSSGTSASGLPWNLTKIQADRVWNELGYNGKGVVVGIIDTGVDPTHPALKGKYRGNHTYQVYSWKNCVDSSRMYPYDDQGHGTHVAGTILGDDGAGNITGVAPGAEWIAAKALDAYGEGFARTLLRAMEWMLAPEGVPSLAPDVVNSSWGGPCSVEYFRTAVQAWRLAGIVPIFAAGNYGPNGKTIAQPACYPESIAVGAVDENDIVASFSSRGPSTSYNEIKPDLAAPGVNILSTYPNGLYTIKRGTSMASPHITGVVALIRQAYPIMTVDEIETLLKNSTVDLGAAGPDNDYGWGRIDAYLALGGTVVVQPPGQVTLVAPSGNVSGRQPTFTWNVVSSATSYRLKINDLAGIPVTSIHQAADVCTSATCSYKVTSSLAGWAYTWQVQASNSAGDGSWSDELSFTVSDAPVPPTSTPTSTTSAITPTRTHTPTFTLTPTTPVATPTSTFTRTSPAPTATRTPTLPPTSTPIPSPTSIIVVPTPGYATYIVQPGDYLMRLAQQWGVSWLDIATLNNIPFPYNIYVGQILKIPGSAAQPTPVTQPTSTPPTLPTHTQPSPVPPSPGTYIVQPGDYLAKLALQWGVNWMDIATLNNIRYPYIIYSGQVLKKPVNSGLATPGQPSPPTATPIPSSNQTYIVQPGDSLAKLALQWGVSWQQIAIINNIPYPYIIYSGQVLKKP